MTPLDRHRIVYLDSQALARSAVPAAVLDWVASGHPLIARRPLCSDASDLVPLGLPLPPSRGKQRLTVAVPPEAIVSDAPPPLLADAAIAAPPAWQMTIAAIVALDPDTRCFGSLAWAWLTGLPYLSATSDLDLLWTVSDVAAIDRLMSAIAGIDEAAPIQLDGEFVAPNGLAVQWREWASEAPDVLAKASDGNRLVARAAVFA